MLCPLCNVDLLIADKQGIEIDYCPKCRGIWLDRGELEKIVERSSGSSAQPAYSSVSEGRHREHHSDHDYDKHKYYDNNNEDHNKYYGENRNKKKSFFSDFLDL